MIASLNNAWMVAVAACLAAAMLQGCDGIGRELVDRRPSFSGEGGCDYIKLPECDAEEREFDLDAGIPLGAAPANLGECDSGMPIEVVPTLDHALLYCASLRVTLDATAGAEVANETNLSSVSLAIESATPATLTLDHGAFEHVFVHLEGPVTLRVTNTVTFDDVGISGSATENGAPRVELIEVKAELLAIGEPERAFPGQILIKRSTLDDAHLRADALDLSSVRIDHSAIESRSLFAADTVLTTARLGLGHATFSASNLANVHVDTCDALVLISTTFNTGKIPACGDDPLRAYNAVISKADVDGNIDSDGTKWINVRFGVHAPTELLGWSTDLTGVAFCERSQLLRLGDQSNGVHCSDCVDGVLREPLCVIADGVVEVGGNLCNDLSPQGGMAPMCGGEIPKRPRP